MSNSKKNAKRNRKAKTFVPTRREPNEGIGPFRVTVTVFGVYTHGHLVGKTNPKAFCRIVMHGDTVKKALGKLNVQTDGAFYRIEEIVDEGREAIAIHTATHAATEVVVPDEMPDAEYEEASVEELLAVGRAIAPVVNEIIGEDQPGITNADFLGGAV